MKWTKRFAVILAAVCCLCGCTKSTIISPEAPSDVELLVRMESYGDSYGRISRISTMILMHIHSWSLSAQASLRMRIQ